MASHGSVGCPVILASAMRQMGKGEEIVAESKETPEQWEANSLSCLWLGRVLDAQYGHLNCLVRISRNAQAQRPLLDESAVELV